MACDRADVCRGLEGMAARLRGICKWMGDRVYNRGGKGKIGGWAIKSKGKVMALNLNIEEMYAVLWEPNVILDRAREIREQMDEDGYMEEMVRMEYVSAVGWTSLSCGFVLELARFIGERKALELGAGNGHLTAALRAGGVDITGVDVMDERAAVGGLYGEVAVMDAVEAVERYPADALILGWPSDPDEDLDGWSARALERFKGEHVIVIGDPFHYGTRDFWMGLREGYELEDVDLGYESFIHEGALVSDRCEVYRRKR